MADIGKGKHDVAVRLTVIMAVAGHIPNRESELFRFLALVRRKPMGK